jgi:transcription elongation GreA/GreB family factor
LEDNLKNVSTDIIMTIKNTIHQTFYSRLLQNIASQLSVQKDLQVSAANETKSTAGDKHETALAMLQMEQAQVGKKMDVLQQYLLELNQIDVEKKSSIVIHGSLIKTSGCYFYISAALGKIHVAGMDVFAISIRSPLGMLFLGKKAKDTIVFNETTYSITELL